MNKLPENMLSNFRLSLKPFSPSRQDPYTGKVFYLSRLVCYIYTQREIIHVLFKKQTKKSHHFAIFYAYCTRTSLLEIATIPVNILTNCRQFFSVNPPRRSLLFWTGREWRNSRDVYNIGNYCHTCHARVTLGKILFLSPLYSLQNENWHKREIHRFPPADDIFCSSMKKYNHRIL